MFFRQYHLECLSLFSYLIGDPSTGRAVVVDPQRDISEYLADAEEHGLSIERILETHFHADFLSGHLELAEATGAAISYGPGAQADFPIAVLADGERLSLGQVELEILHTPGHTPESMCIVVRETPIDEPWAVLTGDTLFIGDVGRPDLLTSIGRSAEELGLMLYESLHNKLMPLPDSTLVYPGHGAGSACGKQLSTATSSTIGEQRENNYALASMDAQHFIEVVTQGQSVAPLYFAYAADTNRRIHALLDDTAAPPKSTLPQRSQNETGERYSSTRARRRYLLRVMSAVQSTSVWTVGSPNTPEMSSNRENRSCSSQSPVKQPRPKSDLLALVSTR